MGNHVQLAHRLPERYPRLEKCLTYVIGKCKMVTEDGKSTAEVFGEGLTKKVDQSGGNKVDQPQGVLYVAKLGENTAEVFGGGVKKKVDQSGGKKVDQVPKYPTSNKPLCCVPKLRRYENYHREDKPISTRKGTSGDGTSGTSIIPSDIEAKVMKDGGNFVFRDKLCISGQTEFVQKYKGCPEIQLLGDTPRSVFDTALENFRTSKSVEQMSECVDQMVLAIKIEADKLRPKPHGRVMAYEKAGADKLRELESLIADLRDVHSRLASHIKSQRLLRSYGKK